MAKKKTLQDLHFDTSNINAGSEEGMKLLEKSFEEVGAGRSIVTDKNDVIIAGNKSAQVALNRGMTAIQEIESDGSQLIVIKRTDIDINSVRGAKMKILDNTTSKLNYVEDAKVSDAIAEEYQLDKGAFGLDIPDPRYERRIELKPNLSFHRKGEMYFFSIYKVNRKDGEKLIDMKKKKKSADIIADEVAGILKAMIPKPQSWAIVTTPSRSHTEKLGYHFASLIAQKVSSLTKIEFIKTVFAARTKQKIEPDITLNKKPGKLNIVLLDDIFTTGSTVKACWDLISKSHNVLVFPIINNNK